MDDRRMQFRVGAVVLATFIIGGLLVALNGPAPQSWVPWAQGKYEIFIELDQAPGIAANTPIRKNGILIGRVSEVRDMDDHVVVSIRIDDDIKLYPDPFYACQVRTSVLGDSTIDFVSRRVPQGTVPLQDGGVVRGHVLDNPLDMIGNMQGDFKIVIDSLSRAGDEVAVLARSLNDTFGRSDLQDGFGSVLDKTVVALDKFSGTMDSIDEVLGDKELRRLLKSGLEDLPIAIREIQDTMVRARETLSGFDKMVDSADSNLDSLTGFTRPLGDRGEEIVNAMLDAVEGVDRLLEEVAVFTGSITNSDGTIGRLVSDPELYNNANQLLKNANVLVWRINESTKQLRPILDDVRVFTDKVSRNPGRVIGGAFDRGPNFK